MEILHPWQAVFKKLRIELPLQEAAEVSRRVPIDKDGD